MKKRDKHFINEKRRRALEKALDDNREAQAGLGWINLAVPIHIGWTAYLVPRADAQNRADADAFWELCDIATTDFCRKRDGFWWQSKKNDRHLHFRREKPHVPKIPQSEYDRLTNGAKKKFSLTSPPKGKWGQWYACSIPNFYFEIAFRKKWRTKVKVIDTVLLQEEAELKDALRSEYWITTRYCQGVPHWFRRNLNVKERRRVRRFEQLALTHHDPDEIDFRTHHKGAAWLWW